MVGMARRTDAWTRRCAITRVRRFRIADPPQLVESPLGAGHNFRGSPKGAMACPLDELCQALSATHPGTTLTLRYSTKPHR